jgi:hypothetical protein
MIPTFMPFSLAAWAMVSKRILLSESMLIFPLRVLRPDAIAVPLAA